MCISTRVKEAVAKLNALRIFMGDYKRAAFTNRWRNETEVRLEAVEQQLKSVRSDRGYLGEFEKRLTAMEIEQRKELTELKTVIANAKNARDEDINARNNKFYGFQQQFSQLSKLIKDDLDIFRSRIAEFEKRQGQ